jgi:glycosyltransferase
MRGASNKSLKNLLRKSSEDYRTMKMYDIGGIGTLVKKNISKIPQFINVNR